MQISIRSFGNSKGVLLPKAMLAQAGLEGSESAAISVEDGSIVLRKPAKPVREGWAQAAAVIAAQDGEFGEGDAEAVR